jgi:hypothetical protein
MKLIVLIGLLLLSAACSLQWPLSRIVREQDKALAGYDEYDSSDYIEQYRVLKKFYKTNPDVEIIQLPYRYRKFLRGIISKIISNNELFFERVDEKFNFYVVKDDKPFYFSLPDQNIYLSSGLIDKYIKSENLMFCLLTYELIKIEKLLFKKVSIYPKGIVGTSKVLSLTRIETDSKIEVHKWAFYLLKRAGITSDNYLSWLQIQNRNSFDFRLMMGDVNSISQEEALFKSFLIKNQKKTTLNRKYKSSREFYRFVNFLKNKQKSI